MAEKLRSMEAKQELDLSSTKLVALSAITYG